VRNRSFPSRSIWETVARFLFLIPILPVRIDGLFELKMAGKKFASPGQIQVRMGKPMRFAPGTNPEEIARAVQNAVQGL